MTLSIDKELRQTFALAALRRQAEHLRTPEHWARASDIQQRASKILNHENDDFANRYGTRVEVALRRLMHEAGSRDRRDLTPIGTGTDRFSPDALLRQAQRDVRQSHERRISRIGEAEQRSLTRVVQEAARENAIRGLAVIDFRRATQEHGRETGPQNSGPSRS